MIRAVLTAATRKFRRSRKAGAAPGDVRVTVNVPAGVSSADIGRVITEHIRACERRSGSQWRQ